MNCGENLMVTMMVTVTVTVAVTVMVTGDEDEDGDVHRSHGDAGQEATAKTCHPL